jgi:hypothetical protein
MGTKEIAQELQHYLEMYSIRQDDEYLTGILTYSAMLAGRVTK